MFNRGDPELERELQSEINQRHRWRRNLVVLLVGILVVLAGVLLVGLLEPTPADSSDSVEGQHLVFEEPGFAVTVPSDWQVRRYEPPWDESGTRTWAVASYDIDGPEWQACVFETGTRIRAPGDASGPSGVVYPEPTPYFEWLDLPAGRVLYVEPPPEPELAFAYYSFPRGAHSALITCEGRELPTDRWRSVAASFQFLSDAPQVVAVLPGVSMAFPVQWDVREDRGQLAGAPGWEKALWATDEDAVCQVAYDLRASDGEALPAPDEVDVELREYLRLRAARSVDPIPVELPVGPAWRADWTSGSQDTLTDHRLYQVPVGSTSLRVACFSESWADAPEDRWRSIVETVGHERVVTTNG